MAEPTVHVALFTHAPDAPSAEGEVSGEGYSRAPLTDGAIVFPTVVVTAWIIEDWID